MLDVHGSLPLALAFGRYREAKRLSPLLPPAFLRERALPQVPIGGDATRGFAVDEDMIADIAAELGEPVPALLAATVRLMLARGSRHVAKLYVYARLSGDDELVRRLQAPFDARTAWPRRRLPGVVGGELLQEGDGDDYNPKSAYLFGCGDIVVKEHLRLAIDPSRIDGYSEEREILAALDHPRAPRLLEVLTWHHHELLVLRRAPGRSLAGAALPLQEARAVVRQLAELLAWLHAREILHLDLKPANLVWDGHDVTLCDFGMARRGHDVYTLPSTNEYIPPEIATAYRAGPCSDVYQLGLVARELGWRDPIVDAMLAPDPRDRPSAAAVLERL